MGCVMAQSTLGKNAEKNRVSLRSEGFIDYDEYCQLVAGLPKREYETAQARVVRICMLWGSLCKAAKAERMPLKAVCYRCNCDIRSIGELPCGTGSETNVRTCVHYDSSYGWKRVMLERASIGACTDMDERLKVQVRPVFMYFVAQLKK